MSNVIDELKVVFTADTGGLMSGLTHIGAQLGALQGMSGAAQASLNALGTALSSGLAGMAGAAQASMSALEAAMNSGFAGISGSAYSAGSAAGAAFAGGLRAQAGNIRNAAKYLSAQAVSSLGSNYSVGSYSVNGDTGDSYAADGSSRDDRAAGGYSGGSVVASGFEASVMSGSSESNVSSVMRTAEVVVPLNVDGVKLGEACIRAMDRVSGMTGRAHIAI